MKSSDRNESMKIAFACDHRGFEIKSRVLDFFKKRGFEVIDCGTSGPESMDYPDTILKAAELVAQGAALRAVGACYTGIGSAIAANKVLGVRAALVGRVEEARLSRAHNDSNMMILGTGFLSPALIEPILETWIDTPFEGGRHAERVNKIRAYEQKHIRS